MKFLAPVLILALASSALAALPRRGTLGIPLQMATPEVVKSLGIKGAAVQVVEGPLPEGFKPGEVIVKVGGKAFASPAEFSELVRQLPVGKEAVLTVIAEGKTVERRLPIAEKPRETSATYEVLYDDVQSHGHRIRTIISKPKEQGKHPVFFWIQGITTGSVDFPLAAGNTVAKTMKAFADTGYVTVRVEKTGVGDSEGGPAIDVGFDEETDIYRQALKALVKYDFVDPNRIFIFGHSMGGCHAPIVASEFPVKGIITYGTVCNSWLEWEINAPRVQGILGGQSPADVDDYVRKVTGFYHYLFNEKRTVDWIKKNRPELKAIADEQSPDGKYLNPRSIPYMQVCNDKNYCRFWEKVGDAKVLALFGQNDWISLEADQHQVAACVNRVHPGNATFTVVPGADHGFNKATSMADSFAKFGKPGAEYADDLVKIVRAWMEAS
jgi:pimeloyl-ACP methyl ester carboxylesterase